MSRGYSYESFAGVIRVHVSIMYDWEARHWEWKRAKEEAFAACRLWWEKQVVDNILNPQLQGSVWTINMQNRFGWKTKAHNEIDAYVSADVSHTRKDPKNMTEDEVNAELQSQQTG